MGRMKSRFLIGPVAIVFGAAIGLSGVSLEAQAGQALGSVRLPRAVVANGQSLPAGTYTLRLSSDTVSPVVGQGPEAAKWVEFVQAGSVKGKELASVVAPADVKAVAEITPPAPGTAKVQPLRGGDYMRVWFNRAGTQYLVHLSTK